MGVFTAAATIGSKILGLTVAKVTFATVAVGLLAQTALGLALNALMPKPRLGGTQARGYNVTQRGSALDHQIIYGRARVGGVVVFDTTSGVNNKFLHRVLAFAGHQIESYEEVYINGKQVTEWRRADNDAVVAVPSDVPNGVGLVPYTVCDRQPDGSFTSCHNRYAFNAQQVRVNNLVLRFYDGSQTTADPTLVADTSEWDNTCILNNIAYVTALFGFDQDSYPNGVPEINVTIKGKKVYDPRTDTTVWSDNPALCLRDYLTSDYGLAEATANIDDTLVAAAANACDRTANNGQPWFTCNGNLTTAQSPYDILSDMLTSMGGLLWYAQGKWRMKPAYWVAPTLTLTEDDLRSSVAVKTRHSRRDNFNTVKGTFRGEETDWQVADYPEVTNAAFLAADNGQESVADINLPYTDNADEARRIARIALERNRQQLTVSASFGLRAFECQVGDVINLTFSRFGWTAKTFEVTSWTFDVVDNLDLQVQMTLREVSESVFDEVDDGVVYERDNTTLLSAFEVPPIGLNATATTQVLREKLTNIINITTSSGRPEAIDRIEVEFKKSTESNDQYTSVGTGELGLFRVVDVDTGNYDFRARAINSFGVKGEWEYIFNISANGLLSPPADVEGLTAEVNGATIHLEWEPVSDLDLSYYRIRHSVEESGATWANATTAVDKVPRPASAVSLPTRPGTYHIKAVDKSGIASENYTSVVVPEVNLEDFSNTDTQTEDPTFSGTKTDCSVTSGELEITDPSTSPSTATYDFSTYIDTGSARRVRSRVEVNVVRKDETSGLWDDLPGLFDDLPGLFDDFTGDADFADTNVQTYISITQDDPAGSPTWTDYQLFRAGDYYGRAFRFRAILSSTSDNITPSVTGLKALVEYN